MNKKFSNFLDGDVSHLAYSDQLRVFNVEELIREIKINAEYATAFNEEGRDPAEWIEAIFLTAKELKDRFVRNVHHKRSKSALRSRSVVQGGKKYRSYY